LRAAASGAGEKTAVAGGIGYDGRWFSDPSSALLETMRVSVCLIGLSLVWMATASAAPPDFNREVRPILAAHCFKCHGPDDKARESGLRLDERESATKELEPGQKAIVPGMPDKSELVRRIESADESDVMPPPSANKPLSAQQKAILKAWIAAGATYQAHWAFTPPVRPGLPVVQDKAWPKNGIDRFVLARLEAAGLKPAPQADRYTLLRRVSLDLVGLPPSEEEAVAFLADYERDPEGAYERLVERLLASPHYGERWARRWLDLARYADTNGYEKDRVRSIWPYRDWVINALNADMPFDQFTIEQLAGDMLPNATQAQRIATGFHRNTMLNEEGGIDPLEFRYYSSVDRINTTATVWLGLTLGCAQCHTHKFDPIPHQDYYRLMAFLNNADEPTVDVVREDIAARRAEIEKRAAAMEADLPNRFPTAGPLKWQTPKAAKLVSAGGATAEQLPDGSFRLSGENPDKDTYTLTLDSELAEVSALRVQALVDDALPSRGPGRTPHGNFVLTELEIRYAEAAKPDQMTPVKIARADADFSQQGFSPTLTYDGKPDTGWAIHGVGDWNRTRTATYYFEKPVAAPGGKWTIKLDQQYGKQHNLGRVRIQLGHQQSDGRPEAERRKEHRDRKFAAWQKAEAEKTALWTPLLPAELSSNLPLLTHEGQGVVFVSGDKSKRDVYDLTFRGDLAGITALKLEVLPDERLPQKGPGRIDYEGPFGDFFLSEFTANGERQKIKTATHSFANGGNTAEKAIDGDPQTGWSIQGGQGKRHVAVFVLDKPLDAAEALQVQLLFERYYAPGLGKFRLWATKDPRAAEARETPPQIERLLLTSDKERTAEQDAELLKYFCHVAPELAGERAEIDKLLGTRPAFATTLVMLERPPNNPRPTFIHKRGEFLQSTQKVEPGLLSVLAPLSKSPPTNRLEFARWLASPQNPLVARVTVNRQWQAFFGRGLVRTLEDFGYTGEAPSHPELLDWLAKEFEEGVSHKGARGAPQSLKSLHKLIVLSATYQQSSAIPEELLTKDASNALLARMPRVRLEAELVRDAVLKVGGLLSSKIGGPSVFPPQPANVTTEGAYGSLAWKVSDGEDRYRRGLYTFAKRTAPYAMTNTFDGPTGEACIARREVSNTPLQALTLLNDPVILEAAQALGKQFAAAPKEPAERLRRLFERCLTRPPSAEETELLVRFYRAQLSRLQAAELNAAQIAGPGDAATAPERAAWTLIARSLLNLDEFVTRN
jgi:hypothetical protein